MTSESPSLTDVPFAPPLPNTNQPFTRLPQATVTPQPTIEISIPMSFPDPRIHVPEVIAGRLLLPNGLSPSKWTDEHFKQYFPQTLSEEEAKELREFARQAEAELKKQFYEEKKQEEEGFLDKLKRVASTLAHDLWRDVEGLLPGSLSSIPDKVNSWLENLLPEGLLDDLDSYDRQVQFSEKVHENIDKLFKTNLAAFYGPDVAHPNADLALGILPSPYDILGKLCVPTTSLSSIKGWKVGQPINNRTVIGKAPKWSTVRARHWKNKAFLHENGQINAPQLYEPTAENIARMKKGLAPQTYNPAKQKLESIELHHDPSQSQGGLFNFIEVTPDQHARLDPHRHI